MSTGENENDLRKILDLTRKASIILLVLHFYYYCYGLFRVFELRSTLTDRLLGSIGNTGLFTSLNTSKLLALGFLVIGLIGVQGKKDEERSLKKLLLLVLSGVAVYFASQAVLSVTGSIVTIGIFYILLTVTGYILILSGGVGLSRLIHLRMSDDIFNEENETFPQEERLLTNPYSLNFRARYQLRHQQRESFVNVTNPFRGTLIAGSPGAGKSWFIILPAIRQFIEKGYGMFIYDFKYDDLSRAAYNWMKINAANYETQPSFYAINFDDLPRSHRCNPLDPFAMHDITDAIESARTILMGLNREWIKRQGDFFVESPINFVTSIIWFLRKYENGKYCTLPHVIELMQADYDELLPVLNSESEIEVLVNPFITAFQNDAMEQLEGQVSSAKICMARLASPQLYWVLSGNDFTLDINNPAKPKVVCVGNNPEKQSIYGAVLSLYISRLVKLVNKKGRQKCALVFDEYPTIYFNSMDSLIATARSNKVATVLAMQDFSQLRKDYGREQADVIVNICGNVISGQVMGDTAKTLSERFGKIMQGRESRTINRTDTSVSYSHQLEHAVPAAKISALSSGEFVGMIADDPAQKIKLKMFHAEVINDSDKINQQMSLFEDIPVVNELTQEQVLDNYYQIKMDIRELIEKEVQRLIAEKERQE